MLQKLTNTITRITRLRRKGGSSSKSNKARKWIRFSLTAKDFLTGRVIADDDTYLRSIYWEPGSINWRCAYCHEEFDSNDSLYCANIRRHFIEEHPMFPRFVYPEEVVNSVFGPGMLSIKDGKALYDEVWMADGGTAFYLVRVQDKDGRLKVTKRWIPYDTILVQHYDPSSKEQ